MKYLFTYEFFGLPSTKMPSTKMQSISEIEFNDLLQKNCQNYLNSNLKLYRSLREGFGNYIYQEKGRKRTSVEPENIHVIIMSESEKWKDFPKYDEAIIGTTSKYYMTRNSYEMIPLVFVVIRIFGTILVGLVIVP